MLHKFHLVIEESYDSSANSAFMNCMSREIVSETDRHSSDIAFSGEEFTKGINVASRDLIEALIPASNCPSRL